MISRRSFVGGAAATMSAQSKHSRPNLVIVMADDHAGYVWGVDGNRKASTPNLDRFAAQSVRFAQHYCNAPMCTPSRQSLFTGQLPHATGVTRLMTPLRDDIPTLARQLRDTGYYTAVYGKMHFQKPPFPGQHGFNLPATEYEIARLWGQTKPQPVSTDVRTTGPWRPLKDPARIWLNADCLPFPRHDHDMEGSFIAEQAIGFIERHRSDDQPFALWISFMEPHSPFRFPVEDKGCYSRTDFQAPPIGPEDPAQIPLVFRDLTPEDRIGIISAYYTSVRFLDENIGRVLNALTKMGLDENTVVVYTADHGYMLGQHGRFEKHCGYDPALRIPLAIRQTGRYKPRIVRDLTEHVDLSATVLDMLGAKPFEIQHGQSLTPYLNRGSHPHPRTSVFAEHLENEEAYIRTRDYKFIYCTGKRARQEGYVTDNPTPGRYTRLYDLRSDPDEFHDISAKAPALVKSFTEQLLALFSSTHREGAEAPRSASANELLDMYLRPPDA